MGFLMAILEKLLFFVGFIGGTNSFPKPLSKDEEEKYSKMLRDGDENAKKVLIEHNLRLVAHIAKKYGTENDFDDLVSIGTIGLIKGINTYNPDKNTRLAAYIARCIENEILMTMRQKKRLSREISLDETIGSDSEGNNMTLSDTLKAEGKNVEDEVFLKINSKKLINAIKSSLSPVEQKIIIWRYGIGGGGRKTQQEVSEQLGISRSYVSRIEKRSIKKLKKQLL